MAKTEYEQYTEYFDKIKELCIDAYKSNTITNVEFFVENGIPEEYDTKEAFDLQNSKSEMITCVRGNCDSAVDEVVLDFLIESKHMILSDSLLNIFITHGHFYNTGHLPPMMNIDVLMHGHTHVPACEEIGDGKYYMNPGSVSIPKGGSDHSYIMYENRKFEWKKLDGTVYMDKELQEAIYESNSIYRAEYKKFYNLNDDKDASYGQSKLLDKIKTQLLNCLKENFKLVFIDLNNLHIQIFVILDDL